jgi:uncharacterized protein (DUF302 family)
MTVDGLITKRSPYGPEDTKARFEAEVRAKGMTIFAHVDHAAGAAEAGLPLRPTELLIFGNAKAGTPLMQSVPTLGIDLPLRALIWQDAAGRTWISYTIPAGSRNVTGSLVSSMLCSMPWRPDSTRSR